MAERYLVSLDLEGRRCLVVGAGPVALRKARDLLRSGADLRVVAPDVDPGFAAMPGVEIAERLYDSNDVTGAWLVVAATDDEAVNSRVVADAEAAGVWATAADRSGGGALAAVAQRTRGRLTVAVSSNGASPSLATWLAEDLSRRMDQRTIALADHLHAHRYADEVDDITGAVRSGRVAEALDLLSGPQP